MGKINDITEKLEAETKELRRLHCIRLHQEDLCSGGGLRMFEKYPVLGKIKDMGMPTVAGLLAYGELFGVDVDDLAELDDKTMLAMLQYDILRLKKLLKQEMSRF